LKGFSDSGGSMSSEDVLLPNSGRMLTTCGLGLPSASVVV
jgi:hypothetical protein